MVEWVHQTVALRERCDGAGVERGSLLLLPEPPRSQHNQDKRKTFAYPTLAGSSRGHDEAGHDLPSHAEVQACSPVLHATALSPRRRHLAPGCRRRSYVVRTTTHDNPTAVNSPGNSLFTPSASGRCHKESEFEPHSFTHPL